MRKEGTIIERKQLYKQVWSKPMSKLAKDYGISDVGLKKICSCGESWCGFSEFRVHCGGIGKSS